jgi:hypothetical protein
MLNYQRISKKQKQLQSPFLGYRMFLLENDDEDNTTGETYLSFCE